MHTGPDKNKNLLVTGVLLGLAAVAVVLIAACPAVGEAVIASVPEPDAGRHRNQRIARLKSLLNQAVKTENYEAAVIYRDELTALGCTL